MYHESCHLQDIANPGVIDLSASHPGGRGEHSIGPEEKDGKRTGTHTDIRRKRHKRLVNLPVTPILVTWLTATQGTSSCFRTLRVDDARVMVYLP